MLTEILAIYAAATATISLAISYVAYKTGNPRVSGNLSAFVYKMDDSSFEVPIDITIYNRGRAPITIDEMHANFGPGRTFSRDRLVRSLEIPSSPDLGLPFKVEGNSNFKRSMRGKGVHSGFVEKNGIATVDCYVTFSTGKVMLLKRRIRMSPVRRDHHLDL